LVARGSPAEIFSELAIPQLGRRHQPAMARRYVANALNYFRFRLAGSTGR